MKRIILVFLLAGGLTLGTVQSAHADGGIVNAILFYDPSQADSQEVFTNVLPPVLTAEGNHLLLFTIDVRQPAGSAIYESALNAYHIPGGDAGLPLIIVGETALAGKTGITDKFAGLVAGMPSAAWPDLHGLRDALQKAGIIKGPQDAWQKFLNDQPGNSFAIVVLLLLAVSLVYSVLAVFGQVKYIFAHRSWWILPLLLLIGLCVSSYLSYTELTHSTVSCGGISNCQAVQDSPYSRLFGILPVGVFGVMGNLLIGSSFLVWRLGRGRISTLAAVAMLGFAFFGASYSSYLTFLEPFVIGATCMWCLTSATVMSLILPCTIGPVRGMIQAAANAKSR